MNPEEIKNALDNLISGICLFTWNPGTKAVVFDYLNDGAYRMLATTRAAGERYITHNVREMILPQDLPILDKWLADVVADNGDVETTFRYVTFQGALAHMRIKGNLYERHGNDNRIVCTFSDCTEELAMQMEFEKQLNFMSSVIDTKSHFDYQVRTDTCVVHAGGIADGGDEILIPDFLSSMRTLGIHPEDLGRFTETFRRTMQKPCRDRIEYRIKEPDGTDGYRWHQCDLMSLVGHEGYVTHVLGLILDVHERKTEELKLQTRADTDALTQLLNKGATETMIRSEIEAHHAETHMDALMMIDVDDFKYINDHFGHMVGDQVLHFVGETLKENLKGMDVAGRIGGDEFMVFLQNIKSARDPEMIAGHLQEAIRGSFADRDVAKVLSVSIGIAIGKNDSEDYEHLFKEADDALYETKHHGKASYTVFHEGAEQSVPKA